MFRRNVAHRVSPRRRIFAALEPLENRLLMSVNAWKSAVSGSWNDATKWSLGHVPTSSEDATISMAGDYTVTANSGYIYSAKLTVGGATGTQTLNINGTGYLTAYGAISVQTGDAINVGSGGHIYSYAGTNAAATLNGTITLSGSSSTGGAYVNVGGANFSGTGSVVFSTSGTSSTVNQFTGYGATIGSGITVRGKSFDIYGSWTNNGTIKSEGTTADFVEIDNMTNNGTISLPSGSSLIMGYLKNSAGKTISVTGGSAAIYYDFTNAGTINFSNTKLTYAMNITAGGYGTVNRTNSAVKFTGNYDGGSKTFAFDNGGKWLWYGGTLKNGNYDPSLSNALLLDPAQYAYGYLSNVNLVKDLSIPAGSYVSGYGNVNLTNNAKIILNGITGKSSQWNQYSSTLGGNGEVVFNTGGSVTANIIGGNSGNIGSGVVVHGKSGSVNSVNNSGTIIADATGETISIDNLSNSGNIIAAPGTVKLNRYTQTASGAMTVGIGGTTAGTNMGKFNFVDTSFAPTLAGTFNAVTLNGYAPAAGTTFAIGTFAKAATGTFATTNLDAGANHAFDLTLSSTALSLKAKTGTGSFASVSGTTLNVTGTSGIDTITSKNLLGVDYVTMGGKTSVFYDRPLTAEVIKAGAGNDTVTVTGGRATQIFGEAGNDNLSGGFSNDSLSGGDGSDTVAGNGGSDVYAFGNATAAETDVLTETANNGSDTLDFSGVTSAVTINLTSDTALATMTNRTVKTLTAGQAAYFENANGGSGADKITGNAGNNVLKGNAGNDTITGNGGTDSIDGGDGTDTINGVVEGSTGQTDPATVTLQAESAALAGGTAIGTANAGYTGTGYADYGDVNSSVTWTTSRVNASNVTLVFRYANGSTTNRPLSVTVNGTIVGTIACAPTGSWTTWGTVTINAALIKGTNTIKATSTTSPGGGNVDSLTINTSTTLAPLTMQAEDAKLAGGTTIAADNGNFTGSGYADFGSTGSSLTFAVNSDFGGSATLTFRYANGSTTVRPLSISVNGVNIATPNFQPTKNWSDWSEVTVTVALQAGANDVTLTAVGNDGPNIDSLTIS